MSCSGHGCHPPLLVCLINAEYGFAQVRCQLLEHLRGTHRVRPREGVGGVDYDCRSVHDLVVDGNLHRLLQEQIHYVDIHKALSPELGQCRWCNDIILGIQAQKELEGHVALATLYQAPVRHHVHALQEKILEHHHGILCRPFIVRTVFVLQFVIDKGKVYQLQYFSELVILFDDDIV